MGQVKRIMPAKLTTTINKICSVPDPRNSAIIRQFSGYMRWNGSSKHHQPRRAKVLMYHTFKFSKGVRSMRCLHEFDHIWMANSRFQTRQNLLERLGRYDAEPFDLDLSDCHV